MSELKNTRRSATENSSIDDAVRVLLRHAGRRPPVPTADAAIVKAAARAEWLRVAQAQRHRRWVRRSVAVLAAAAALFLVLNPELWRRTAPAPSLSVATVEVTSGTVWATHGVNPSSASALSVGEELVSGTVIETRTGNGLASRAVLQLASGYSLRLDVGSRIRLESDTVVALESGALYVDSRAVPADSAAIAVHTPSGVVRDIGTRFTVRVGPGEHPLSVRVRDGAVVLEQGKAEHIAHAGTAMLLRGDGEVSLLPILAHDESWSWVQALLPAYDTEGRSLYEFLEWAAVEGGWQLRIADPELATRASQVVLHGSIAGLSLSDALTLSLLSSGLDLEYRAAGAELIIERTPQPR